ncbi:TadE family protein [Pyxidicoccus sp. MSG2]|uniref:TadE family protein n=1 Tax=Pyxidicoccus sp. MSG2 TaxID=2996790 RepID=UPI002271A568|nr:TadE family protein [Pyxidicoccus sp. MSG2]MCY1017180.1 pilus assembly protein [Pyxidicoccus sp. MSG2]
MNGRKRGAQRGAATVELALVAPILVVLVLWANYFWELQRVRLKAAELARFMAFERTVRTDLTGITVEARKRYQDLDGSTRTGELGTAFRNRLTLEVVQVENEPAPLIEVPLENRARVGNASRFLTPVTRELGANAEDVAREMELNLDEGAVLAKVRFEIKNGIIPDHIALYTTGLGGDWLDLSMTEQFFLVHDTWRAWAPGDNPLDSYAAVEQHTFDRTQHIVYKGVKQQAGGALSAIGGMASMFRLDNIDAKSYIRESVKILPVGVAADYSAVTATYTVPGNVLHAAYWKDDTTPCFGTCEPEGIKQKRGLISGGADGENWPMRAYNCRGEFFQGAAKSELPESVYGAHNTENNVGREYHNYGDRACQ